MITDDIQVVDNFFPNFYLKTIIGELERSYIKTVFWHNGVSGINKPDWKLANLKQNINAEDKVGTTIHPIYRADIPEWGEESPFRDSLKKDLPSFIEKKFNIRCKELFSINLNISSATPDFPDDCYTVPHVDMYQSHQSIVFYFDDIDGDTVLFNNFWPKDNILDTKMKIVQKVTPKKNQCLLFNGLRYHALIPSKKGLRRVLSINFFTN